MDADAASASSTCADGSSRDRRASAFIGGFLAFWFGHAVAAPIAVTDDLGRKVELAAPAQRIVSLAPFLTELAFSAGAGPRMVGASAHSDYPEAARALPQVASAVGIAFEPLAAARADLVLAWRDTIRAEDIERVQALGPRVFVAQAKSLDDAPRLLLAIATLAGTDASRAAGGFRDRLGALRARYAGRTPLRVFLEVWHKPLTTIAGRHWMNEALAVCGARNVFGELPSVAPVVGWEEVIARAPDAIVGTSVDPEPRFRANWRARAGVLEAAAKDRLLHVESDLLHRPSMRLVEGVALLCDGLDRMRAREESLSSRR